MTRIARRDSVFKALGKTGFQFHLIFYVLRISEINMTYLDKNVTEFN